MLGDPHLRTLDGNSYTFNGFGEYRMIDAQHENSGTRVVVQGRTVALANTTATVVTAAALGLYNTTTSGKGFHGDFFVSVGC